MAKVLPRSVINIHFRTFKSIRIIPHAGIILKRWK